MRNEILNHAFVETVKQRMPATPILGLEKLPAATNPFCPEVPYVVIMSRQTDYEVAELAAKSAVDSDWFAVCAPSGGMARAAKRVFCAVPHARVVLLVSQQSNSFALAKRICVSSEQSLAVVCPAQRSDLVECHNRNKGDASLTLVSLMAAAEQATNRWRKSGVAALTSKWDAHSSDEEWRVCDSERASIMRLEDDLASAIASERG